GDAVLTREEVDEPILGEQLETDQDLAELLARSLLVGERQVELLLRDQAVGDEQVAEAPADRRLALATGCHGHGAALDLAAVLGPGFRRPRVLLPSFCSDRVGARAAYPWSVA